jgi:hypothetical protein
VLQAEQGVWAGAKVFISGIFMPRLNVTRGYGDRGTQAPPHETDGKGTHGGRTEEAVGELVDEAGLDAKEVEEGGVVHGGRGPSLDLSGGSSSGGGARGMRWVSGGSGRRPRHERPSRTLLKVVGDSSPSLLVAFLLYSLSFSAFAHLGNKCLSLFL